MKISLTILAFGAAVLVSLHGSAADPAGAGAQPPAVPIMGKPAPVNPFNGVQQREDVFEFAEKPKVVKEGDRWVITFASKAACDATITILDKDGKVVRHLASGVLGKNAPWPFQQNSLSQRLEWDGLTTDFKKADPAGCSVHVGLGLKPEFERNILWDAYELLGFRHSGARLEPGDQFVTVRGKDGAIYVIDAAGNKTAEPNGRVYDKTGKYLRTFFPPSAADFEKLAAQQGYKLATTAWGDRVVVGGAYGFTTGSRVDVRGKSLMEFMADPLAALKMQPDVGEEQIQVGPRPPELPPSKLPRFKTQRGGETSVGMALHGKFVRMTVDRRRDEIYVGYIKGVGLLRFDGKTGRWDDTWFPKGDLTGVTECSFGPDDLLYLRIGPLGYGRWVLRLDRQGKPVSFTGKDAMDFPRGPNWPDDKYKFGGLAGQGFYGGSSLPPPISKADVKVMWTGEWDHSNTHSRGLYVAPNGMIVASILYQSMERMGQVPQYLVERGMPQRREGASYVAPWSHESFVALMDAHGNYYSANAVGSTCNGHNVFMDREGNIYSGLGGLVAPQSLPYGIKAGGTATSWGGFASFAKFQWTGQIPVTTFDYAAGAAGLGARPGTLWIHKAIIPGYAQACTCHNNRTDMDYWARTWIGANQLGSLIVLDSNGNLIGRFGRYGNVDDADEAHGRLHFAWIRAVAVSDTAAYVVDQPNRRIVRAALKYAAEAAIDLP